LDLALVLGIGGLIGLIVGTIGLVYGLTRKPQVIVQQAPENEQLKKELAQLPNKLLQALKSSTSNIRGAMAEHISFLKLSSDYDRLIPIGNVVDFIGIKFDTKKESFDGHIDFIDIKTGKSRLTQDQMKVKRLADGGRTRFVKIKINTDATVPQEPPDED
jgi:predicted Holliday junction resolvase-like endonuclease